MGLSTRRIGYVKAMKVMKPTGQFGIVRGQVDTPRLQGWEAQRTLTGSVADGNPEGQMHRSVVGFVIKPIGSI